MSARWGPIREPDYGRLVRLISYMSPGFPRSLFETIGRLLEADVTFDETRSGPVPDDDPFADRSVDAGWICSTSYVGLALASPAPTVQLAGVAWVPDDPDADGRAVYFGDLVVPAGSPIRCFDDLAGATIGCNDPVSLSGHYSLRFAMGARGLDPDSFATLRFTGGHQRSLELVAAGHLDAAVVDSVVRTTRSRTDSAVASLRVIERLGPWPVQPLVVRADVPRDEVERIQATLLEAADAPAIRDELSKAGLAGLVAVGDDHYRSVERAMAQLG